MQCCNAAMLQRQRQPSLFRHTAGLCFRRVAIIHAIVVYGVLCIVHRHSDACASPFSRSFVLLPLSFLLLFTWCLSVDVDVDDDAGFFFYFQVRGTVDATELGNLTTLQVKQWGRLCSLVQKLHAKELVPERVLLVLASVSDPAISNLSPTVCACVCFFCLCLPVVVSVGCRERKSALLVQAGEACLLVLSAGLSRKVVAALGRCHERLQEQQSSVKTANNPRNRTCRYQDRHTFSCAPPPRLMIALTVPSVPFVALVVHLRRTRRNGRLQEEVLEGSGIVAQPTSIRGKKSTPLARAMLKVSHSVTQSLSHSVRGNSSTGGPFSFGAVSPLCSFHESRAD